MKFKRWHWGLLVALIALIAIVLAAQGKKEPDAASAAMPPLELGRADYGRVRAEPIVTRIDITGTLEAINQTTLTSAVEAEIAAVLVRPGMAVNQGQVVVEFSTTDLQLRLNQQLAQLEAARAQLRLARTTHEQQRALLQQHFISENAFQVSQNNLANAQAQVKANESLAALARQHVKDAVVRAPFDAQVAERMVDPGQRVMPNSPLLRIVDPRELELESAVASNEIGRVQIGQPVELRVEGEDKTIAGSVIRIAPSADAASRRVPVFIRVINADGALRSGLFARGNITVAQSAPVATVPIAAIQRDSAGRSTVWVVSGQRLRKQIVTVGPIDSVTQRVAVLRGLNEGDVVIIIPGADLREGQAVKLGA